MQKAQAIQTLAKHRGDAISVTTMQAAYPWHAAGQTSAFHIEAVACMGSASSLGLGLALGAPDRRVMVLDGDGSLLMQLGSLVTIGAAAPAKFFHFVFSNGYYESSGNQPVPGAGRFDLVAMAKAAGYRFAVRYEQADELDRALPALFLREGPILIDLIIARDDATPRWSGVPMAEMVRTLRSDLGTERKAVPT
jgi:sulfopyruvate decarboxylase subunit beta